MLFSHLNRDPPAGYNRCSVSQLLAADRAAWCSLIEVNTKPVAKPSAQPGTPANKPQPAKGNRKGSNRFKPYGSKGKGKGKGKADQRIPREIREAGGTASTPTGDPICFDFSLRKCKEPIENSRCRKGYHVCAICYGQHCMLDHKKA